MCIRDRHVAGQLREKEEGRDEKSINCTTVHMCIRTRVEQRHKHFSEFALGFSAKRRSKREESEI